ncbi:ABC transporter ATP-binding protein [Paenibacillus cymbidii]|uniref:ABC transporter ATP-binding protein n=1 Tax=Paenibacillus cymbidii TaxID=1639034 RepID=UPI0010804422|nr:ABC transporter ATP-binding protein [Paenibacillus cymbidii]
MRARLRLWGRSDGGASANGSAAGKEPEALASAHAEQPLLEAAGVTRSFGVGGARLDVLRGVDIALMPGRLVMLRGRSGSGKTTLLNLLGGLDVPTGGEIRFLGEPLHRLGDAERTRIRRKRIGFIFQAYALMPMLSAYENVELSLRLAGVPRAEWKRRTAQCLELVGLGKRASHRPFELSGGEQQRVCIAKAIAHKPLLLLADEPTAELDSIMTRRMIDVFRAIIADEGATVCMTTHDATIVEEADHVYEMADGALATG